MKSNNYVAVDKIKTIAIVTLTCGDRLNVMDAPMLKFMKSAFISLKHDKNVRCLIVRAEGRAFSAGADLKKVNKMPARKAAGYSRRGQEVMNLLESFEIPTIAQIDGAALGGGCELALAATFRIASNSARIGLPELRLGLIPGFGGTQRLPRLIGVQAARRLILTSEILDAGMAKDIGLIDWVTEPAQLSNVTNELAYRLSTTSAPASRAAMCSISNALDKESRVGFESEALLFAEVFNSWERKEGISAFLGKRPPNFTSTADSLALSTLYLPQTNGK